MHPTHRQRPARHGGGGNAAELRTRVAAEAARLIVESGIRDYGFAKQKAAERLGLDSELTLPKNREIEEAVRAHLRLFRSDLNSQHLHKLRLTAIEAMRFLEEFQPRLVDAVLDGTADEHSAVSLHLFSEDPDAPTRFLEEHGIRHQHGERTLRSAREEHTTAATIAFAAGDTSIDLTIFPLAALPHAPLDRLGEKPMRRAKLETVLRLVDDDLPHIAQNQP